MGSPEPPRSSNDGFPPLSHGRGTIPVSIWAGTLFSWLGVCLCFVLLQRESGLGALFCPARGTCEAVLGSQYAQIRGIPLAAIGAAFYAVALGLWLTVIAHSSRSRRLWLVDAILWLVVTGLTFSAGLMYLQFAVIRAFCPLCVASVGTMIALLAAAIRARRMVDTGAAGTAPASAWALAFFAIFPALVLVGSHLAGSKSPGGMWLVDLSTAHRLGPVNAPVQLVVYSDFQCGYCRQFAPVLRRLEGDFPQDLTIVYRHYPLSIHPRALPAAIASECAAAQGRFWEYHDKLFAEGGDLSDARLAEVAAAIGLDPAKFQASLQTRAPHDAVEANLREAEALSVPGTPFVFLNGRRLEGSPTYENLAAQIKKIVRAVPSKATPRP